MLSVVVRLLMETAPPICGALVVVVGAGVVVCCVSVTAFVVGLEVDAVVD